MSLGACRLTKRILVLVVGLWASLNFISCGGSSKPKDPPSGLPNRLLASQGVTATFSFGGLVILNGYNDTIPSIAHIQAGSSPGLMVTSPSRNIAATFDASSSNVYAVDTHTESGIGNVRIQGPTSSMVFPTAVPIGYVAIPTATVGGYSFVGAVDIMNFSASQLTTIAVTNAQTVIANGNGAQLIVFSNDSDSVTVLNPNNAVPPVDLSCLSNAPNSVCTIVPGFDRPVYGIVNGNTAYILNCGPQCGGKQASVMLLDLPSLTITAHHSRSTLQPGDSLTVRLFTLPARRPRTMPVPDRLLQPRPAGVSTLWIWARPTVTEAVVITDGYHDRMDITTNGQVFIGSHDCTNIGNVSFPSGEVRGCLSIYRTLTIPCSSRLTMAT